MAQSAYLPALVAPPHPLYSVLAVDDDPNLLRTMEGVLCDDFAVTTCASPTEALVRLQKQSFHVVCSDFQMPGMNGAEFLKEVAALPTATSCILVTGIPDLARKAIDDHAAIVMVVSKPYDPERLIRLVEQLARLTEVKRSLAQNLTKPQRLAVK